MPRLNGIIISLMVHTIHPMQSMPTTKHQEQSQISIADSGTQPNPTTSRK